MVNNCGSVVGFREEGWDDLVWHLQPRFHGLPEPWHQIQEFAHAEHDRAVHEGFPNPVHLLWDDCVGCGWCYVLAHPLDIHCIGLGYPFLGFLSYFILLLPFYHLRLAPGCDLLHFGHDNVDDWLLPFLIVGSLRRIVPGLLTIKTMDAILTFVRA